MYTYVCVYLFLFATLVRFLLVACSHNEATAIVSQPKYQVLLVGPTIDPESILQSPLKP